MTYAKISHMKISGKILKILTSNIDTDQIIPARHLTGISKTGLGLYLFEDLPHNPLDAIEDEGSTIIVTYENFGCGSSREHAVWAIQDRGFQAVIASSFARIFEENCYNNGLIPIVLSLDEINELAQIKSMIEIDVINQEIKAENKIYKFNLDKLKKEFLLKGGFMKFLDSKVETITAWAKNSNKLS